jgi:hypothetical protein
MGETKLLELEAMLTDDIGVLGVDEHTAVIIDIESGVAEVRGNGTLTLRHRETERVVPSGERVSLDEMRAALLGDASAPGRSPAAGPARVLDDEADPSEAPVGLRQSATQRRRAFDEALASGDGEGALEQALGLEQDIHDWSRDTLQSDDIDVARATLRAMLVDLATAAQSGLRDERDVIGPFVDIALDARQRARAAKDFAASDAVRDGLIALGIEVRDTPDGATWERSAP